MKIKLIVLLVSLLSLLSADAQTAPADTTQPLEILAPTQRNRFQKLPDGSELQILAGTVKVRQGTTLFYCDSLVVNSNTNILEAFGRVHINDSDTAHVYSKYLRYLVNERKAFLTGNVKLTDGHGTLTTNNLEYDVATKVGTYRNGGRVVNKKSVLTSDEGVYYADIRDVYFKKNVRLKDPAFSMRTDSMIYNTETQMARFITETFMIDSSGRTIQTREGFYDLREKRAEFTQRTRIQDKSMVVLGDQIANDDQAGIIQIRGNGVLIDSAQGVNILANEIFANKKTGAYLATKKPLMIIRQEKDSIYVAADTLFSARLTDLYGIPDSAQKQAAPVAKKGKTATSPRLNNDSTNRYFEAFRNVRVFSDSVQAVSDSMFYSFKDSTFRLYDNPVVWSRKSQILGDTIYLFTKNKKADRIKVFENSFVINESQAGIYNQVKSTRMDGFFKEGTIDTIGAKGSAETIYFIQDDDSAYTGINQTTSDDMDVYFNKGNLQKVVFRNAVKGTLTPMSQKDPAAARLEKFEWLERRRPKTKYELFE
ncbi:MAG TPA: OstA-like protein [Flavisolibacter sp.]|nr:OstA-like protein [Flavisolibacter sp.]